MAVPSPLGALAGSWAGTSTLHRSWLEGEEKTHAAASALRIDLTASYANVGYTWHLDGEAQQGTLIITSGAEATTAAWTDTWHADSTIFQFTGGTGDDGVLRLNGTYPAGDGPDWGWRIEFEATGDGMQMRMVNIDPEGVEEWAVQADYRRAK